MIVALEGPRAVGKTTLLNSIQDMLPKVQAFQGIKLESLHNMGDETGFCNNQKEYIKRKINQYESVDSSKINVITRGTENVMFYTLAYPTINGHNSWQVDNKLQEHLMKLNQKRSDLIIYLDANKNILLQRNKQDTRQRVWFDRELDVWNLMMRSWFMQYDNCIFIDTSNLGAYEVLDSVYKILNNF